MVTRAAARPIVSVVTHVASDLAYLVQTEFRLARAELGEKLSALSNAGLFLGLGGVLALSGLIVLLFDIARWITVAGLPYEWSMLIVALVTLVLGAILAMAGVNKLKASELVPNRTIGQVREDYTVVKEHVG